MMHRMIKIAMILLAAIMPFAPARGAGIALDQSIEVSFHDMPQGIIDLLAQRYAAMDAPLDEFEDFMLPRGWIVDLNDDRQKEYIIFEPFMSGANPNGVATQIIAQKTSGGWSIIAEINGPWLYKAGPGITRGYMDLYGGNTVAGANFSENKFVWTGSEYAAAPPEYEYYSVSMTNGTLNLRDAPSTTGDVIYSLENNQCVAANSNTCQADGYEWVNINLPKTGWTATKFLKKSKTCAEAFAVTNEILELFRGQYELAAEDACTDGGGGYELFLPEAYFTWINSRTAGKVIYETFRTNPNTLEQTKEQSSTFDPDNAGYEFYVLFECGDDVDATFHKTVIPMVDATDANKFHVNVYTGADCIPNWQFTKIKGKWMLQKEVTHCIY